MFTSTLGVNLVKYMFESIKWKDWISLLILNYQEETLLIDHLHNEIAFRHFKKYNFSLYNLFLIIIIK